MDSCIFYNLPLSGKHNCEANRRYNQAEDSIERVSPVHNLSNHSVRQGGHGHGEPHEEVEQAETQHCAHYPQKPPQNCTSCKNDRIDNKI